MGNNSVELTVDSTSTESFIIDLANSLAALKQLYKQLQYASDFIWMVPYRLSTDAQIINKLSVGTVNYN